jgi:transcriptional regulator NrdR family protein
VIKTERPLDEGLEAGDVKRRTRKCRECSRTFTTFEIQEDLFRELRGVTKPVVTEAEPHKLKRQPLLVEGASKKPRSRIQLRKIKGVK